MISFAYRTVGASIVDARKAITGTHKGCFYSTAR